MNIHEEKQFIYEMMKNVTEERRTLTDIYYGLKERLDFLHKLEEQGIEELDLRGYTELHKKDKERSITNIKKQVEFISSKIQESNIIEEKEKSVIPKEEKTKTIRKRRGRISKEAIYSSIIEILKESGKPTKLNEIHTQLEEKFNDEISYKYLQNTLIRDLIATNEKISRAHKGYYQYKF